MEDQKFNTEDLLDLGLQKMTSQICTVPDLDKDHQVLVNALLSNTDVEINNLNGYYTVLMAGNILADGRLNELYKEEILLHHSLLRAAEFILMQKMEEIAEELQGTESALAGWVAAKANAMEICDQKEVIRQGRALLDQMDKK